MSLVVAVVTWTAVVVEVFVKCLYLVRVVVEKKVQVW